jgi:hypothetical protein
MITGSSPTARLRPCGGPGTARHFVHFSKMVSILRPGEELSGEGYPLRSEPADGQNSNQSSDPIPEAGG